MTTETEIQRQIGSLLWTSDEMKVSTLDDEDIVNGDVGLLVRSKDGSEFQVTIVKVE